jgi:hypothetical protein
MTAEIVCVGDEAQDGDEQDGDEQDGDELVELDEPAQLDSRRTDKEANDATKENTIPAKFLANAGSRKAISLSAG